MNNSSLVSWVATGNINGVGAANEFQSTEGISSNANSHDAFQMTVTGTASAPPAATPLPSSLILTLTGLLLAALCVCFGRNFKAQSNFS